jgi:hypothetical protein
MTNNTNLKTLERKAWRSYFQDGLGDIFLGCIVLMFAIAPPLSRMGLGDFWSSAVFIPFWALIFLLIVLIRKYVVLPRIGVVKFGQTRRKKLLKFNVLMFVVLLLGLILGIISFQNINAPGWVHSLRFIAIVLVGSSLAAYFLDFKRLYVYGIIIALSIPIGEWLYVHTGVPHHGYPITFGITAAIMIIIGLILFVRLLRKYRCPNKEVEYDKPC